MAVKVVYSQLFLSSSKPHDKRIFRRVHINETQIFCHERTIVFETVRFILQVLEAQRDALAKMLNELHPLFIEVDHDIVVQILLKVCLGHEELHLRYQLFDV